MRATPHAVLVPCALGVAYDGQCGQAWCVKWCPHGMHEKIATGFSDGENFSPFTPEICNAFEALFKHTGQASASRVYFKFSVDRAFTLHSLSYSGVWMDNGKIVITAVQFSNI